MSSLRNRRNAKRVNGLRRDPRTGAGKLAKSERGYGGVLAFDFEDNSTAIYDPTTQANVAYTQGITDGNGNLRGPHALLTYTSPSNKLTRQADGYIKYQAHNLVVQSADLSTSWTIERLSSYAATDEVTAPLGTVAFKVIEDSTAANTHRFRQSVTCPVGALYTLSVCVKALATGSSRKLVLDMSDNATGDAAAVFDISAGSADSATQGGSWTEASSAIEDLGDGWYKCSVTARRGAGTQTLTIFHLRDGINTSYNGDGASGLYFCAPHLHRYPANTDYIATTTAAKYALPIEYDTSGNCLGLLVEEARTNLCLYSNDLTQAGSWTASNMTTAKTATGPDNVANSATTITASAGNATILQAITSASADRVTSVYIKRRTGTGDIDLTQDNGSTWTTQAVTSTWTRFSLASVTSANPTVGIRIVTSGDAVDVALFSHEVGAFVTSPIITYGATATRAIDNISIARSATPLPAMTAGTDGLTLYIEYEKIAAQSVAPYMLQYHNGSGNDNIVIYENTSGVPRFLMATTDAGNAEVNTLSPSTPSTGATVKAAFACYEDSYASCVDAGAVQNDFDADVIGSAITTLTIGSYLGSSNAANTVIKKISAIPRRKTDAELQAETA